MNVRFEKTDKGEVTILPRKDYEALVKVAEEAKEDAGTARLVARARREIAAGEPLIPFEVTRAIAKGENPIRAYREWRGLTQIELAAKACLGQGYLSDLENRRRKGTAEALLAIAQALGVPMENLL